MPSLVILPFIQCHHTRGRALCGGFSKPFINVSSVFWAVTHAPLSSSNTAPVDAIPFRRTALPFFACSISRPHLECERGFFQHALDTTIPYYISGSHRIVCPALR